MRSLAWSLERLLNYYRDQAKILLNAFKQQIKGDCITAASCRFQCWNSQSEMMPWNEAIIKIPCWNVVLNVSRLKLYQRKAPASIPASAEIFFSPPTTIIDLRGKYNWKCIIQTRVAASLVKLYNSNDVICFNSFRSQLYIVRNLSIYKFYSVFPPLFIF